MTRRVLFHAPYAAWSYHGAMEAVLAQAIEQRGATTLFTFCDGLFPTCDIFRRGFMKDGDKWRPDHHCLHCQAQQAREFARYGRDFSWLGNWVPRGVLPEARAFADELPVDGLLGATWKGQPVGEWAQSSAFHQFRLSRIELTDPDVRAVLRDCIYGAIVSWEGLVPVFDEFDPEVLVTFNGRFFSQRAAMEVARARGVRVVTHERGYRKGTFLIRQGGGIHELDFFERIWDDWRDVSLTPAQMREAQQILHDRRFGRNLSWKSFSPPPEEAEAVRQKLQLDDRPLVVCFTSSDDEWLTFPERREGPFPDSLQWVPATVQAARDSPDLQWVLRMHPNLVGHGTNHQALAQCRALAEDLPENCRIVQPEDDVSSYTLLDMAAAGVTYGSTMGLEMVAQGRPVVTVSRGWYGQTDMVLPLRDPADYVETVRAAIDRGLSVKAALSAHRFLFHLYQETAAPFPWVEELSFARGGLRYDDPAILAPGANAAMDRYCALLLDGQPLQAPVPPERRGERSEVEERMLLRGIPHLRDAPDRPASLLSDLLDQGHAELAAGRAARASRAFMGAVERRQDCVEGWLGLTAALQTMGQAQGAMDAATQAVRIDTASAPSWVALAQCSAQTGGKAQLVSTLEMARKLDVRHPDLDALARQARRPDLQAPPGGA